eukprot:358344-Chlamydomonas_euryale.AAC.13
MSHTSVPYACSGVGCGAVPLGVGVGGGEGEGGQGQLRSLPKRGCLAGNRDGLGGIDIQMVSNVGVGMGVVFTHGNVNGCSHTGLGVRVYTSGWQSAARMPAAPGLNTPHFILKLP